MHKQNITTKIFKFVLIFLLSRCATLLPPEEREYHQTFEYPSSISDFLETKSKKLKGSMHYEIQRNDSEYAIVKFYSSVKREGGSYLVCSFKLERNDYKKIISLKNISYVLDYGCDNRSLDTPNRRHLDWCLQTRGTMGPTSIDEKNQYMLPCIREFFEN